MSPLQSTCLSHWFKDRLDSTKMRDLGCCAQDMKGKAWTEGSRMLTKFWPCYYVATVHESLGGLEHMERPPKSFERKLDPATLGIQMAHWEWSSLPKRQKRLWFLGILRFEKSCSWRSLFNSGPNSKMSPTQSTCLNHGFKDTLIKLVTKMIEWIYWSHEGNAFCFWPTVSHMLSMRYQNPVPQCWKNLEKPLLDTAGLSKRVYGSWELRKPGKATKVIWKKAGTPDRWKWCRT